MQTHALTGKHVACSDDQVRIPKRRSGRKRFTLEYKANEQTLKHWGEDSMFYRWHHEWTRFSAYATEKARDEALRIQVHKLGDSFDFRGVDL